MKKFLCLLLATMISVSLVSCSEKSDKESNSSTVNSGNGGGSGSVSVKADTSSNNKSEKEEGIFDDEEVLKNLTTTTYTWSKGETYYVALVIKNNSGMDCSLKANIIYKNAEGQNIGVDNSFVEAFEKNTEACIIVNNDEAFTSFDYTYNVEKTEYTKCLTSLVQCEVSATKNKAIVTFTNNSEYEITDGKCNVLFMLGEEAVDYEWDYVPTMKPNDTAVSECDFYNSKKDFDNVKVYYQAYNWDLNM